MNAVDIESAKKLAQKLGARAFADFEEMLTSVDIDMVDICVPTPFHKDCVIRAAKAGKHIVLEKPMARSLADCREMIQVTQDAGVTFMVAQVVRFFPEFGSARAQVLDGAVGKPAMVRMSRGGGFPGSWFGNIEMSGGVVLDSMIHDFDWLLWTFGEAERVYARGLAPRTGELNKDYALASIRFKNGMIAHVEGNWAHTAGGFVVKFEVAGDKGLLDFSNKVSMPLRIHTESTSGAREWLPESPSTQDPFYLELKHFVDCVESGTAPSIRPEESMRATEVGLATLLSIYSGKPVDLPILDPDAADRELAGYVTNDCRNGG